MNINVSALLFASHSKESVVFVIGVLALCLCLIAGILGALWLQFVGSKEENIEVLLVLLNRSYEHGEISDEEYKKKRAEIIDKL